MSDLSSVDPQILSMLQGELEAALSFLVLLHAAWLGDPAVAEENRRVAAAIVLIEEVNRQAQGLTGKPPDMKPFLQCAIYLLGQVGRAERGGVELGSAREHTSAACDLLSSD